MALRHAHEGDWLAAIAAIAAFDGDRQINGLGLDTRRGDDIDHLSALIVGRGVEPVAWYGARLFTDGWTPGPHPTDPEDLVLRAELIASQRDPYRLLSQLVHLVGAPASLTAPQRRVRGDDPLSSSATAGAPRRRVGIRVRGCG